MKDFKLILAVQLAVTTVACVAATLVSDWSFEESVVFGLSCGVVVGGIVGLCLWGSRLPAQPRKPRGR